MAIQRFVSRVERVAVYVGSVERAVSQPERIAPRVERVATRAGPVVPWIVRIVLVAVLALAAVSVPAGAAPAPSAAADADPLARSETDVSADDLRCPVDRVGETGASRLDPVRGGTAAAADDPDAPPHPRIVGLYPNPTTHRNVGEYVVLETPPGTSLGSLRLTDGHTTATFPDATVSGPVAASADPNATETLTDLPVVAFEGTLRLAVDGDHLELREDEETVDVVSYDRAPLAERWYRIDEGESTATGADEPAASDVSDDGDESTASDDFDDEPAGADESAPGSAAGATPAAADGVWFPRDGTCYPVISAADATATAFVLPDAPEVPIDTLESAEDRLLLAGYTITSRPVADALAAAADRGVDVAVLFEAGPVGGTPESTAAVVETLLESDVDVRVVGGEGARYRYHHPKYAVADDRILVTSENWKPSGVGGASSRGWGVRVDDARLADALADVFRADHEGWDTTAGADFLESAAFVDEEPASDRYGGRHDPRTVPVESVDLLLAPENAEPALRDLIAGAEEEILLQQASIDRDVSLLDDVVDAARRGVEVRILLDSTWYQAEDNEAVRTALRGLAADEDLPLEVALADETDRFEKIHAKGVVVDREVAVVGSANWNENALENNREVLLALHGEAVADYYAGVFEDDWGDAPLRVPLSLSLAAVAALALAALVGRRSVRIVSRSLAEGGGRTRR